MARGRALAARPKPGGICSRWPIPFWLPNLFAYLRIAACGKAFTVAFTDKKLFTVLYAICFTVNELNGSFAKAMHQTSTFGDVLFHISSRISNTGLLLVLSHLYRKDYRYMLGLLAIDITSHWLRLYCKLVKKQIACRHLATPARRLLHEFWHHPLFRAFTAISQEAIYIMLYLMSYEMVEAGRPVRIVFKLLQKSQCYSYFLAAVPGFVLKQLVNLSEIKHAMDMCMLWDHEKNLINRAARVARRKRSASRSRGRSRSRSRGSSRSRGRSRSSRGSSFDLASLIQEQRRANIPLQ